jgi:hypothetical protein
MVAHLCESKHLLCFLPLGRYALFDPLMLSNYGCCCLLSAEQNQKHMRAVGTHYWSTLIIGPTGHAIGGTAQLTLWRSSTAAIISGPRHYQWQLRAGWEHQKSGPRRRRRRHPRDSQESAMGWMEQLSGGRGPEWHWVTGKRTERQCCAELTSVDSGVLITSNFCTSLISSNFILILY